MIKTYGKNAIAPSLTSNVIFTIMAHAQSKYFSISRRKNKKSVFSHAWTNQKRIGNSTFQTFRKDNTGSNMLMLTKTACPPLVHIMHRGISYQPMIKKTPD